MSRGALRALMAADFWGSHGGNQRKENTFLLGKLCRRRIHDRRSPEASVPKRLRPAPGGRRSRNVLPMVIAWEAKVKEVEKMENTKLPTMVLLAALTEMCTERLRDLV